MTIYRIKSRELKLKGERIEGLDKSRMEKRLKQVQRDLDPAAKLLTIGGAR